MKKILFIYALAATAVAAGTLWLCVQCRREAVRHQNNIYALCDTVRRYRTRLGEEVASVEALQLKCSEFERLRADDARRIRELGIRLRRLESLSRTTVTTEVEVQMPLRDTLRTAATDTVKFFGWSDGWVSVEGRMDGDNVECRVQSIDTIIQIVHRVPRKFLFIRYGTKGIRQEIVSANPHTHIISARYIEFPRRRQSK